MMKLSIVCHVILITHLISAASNEEGPS